MSPFQSATLPPKAFDVDLTMRQFGITREQAEHAVAELASQDVYLNDRYQVNVTRIPAPFGPKLGDMLHLSIKRRNKAPLHNWRELQQIKNLIVGEENEGVELYPAESRLADCANQYHLWVFADPTVRFPIGWHGRMTATAAEAEAFGGKQRDFT